MSTFKSNREYYLAFNYFNKIGPKKIKLLENYFPNLEQAFWSSSSFLEKTGLSFKIIKEFLAWRPKFSLKKTLAELNSKNIKFITYHEEKYPKLLKEIYNPPPLLYFKGDLEENNRKNRLAVVGSRKHSNYAQKIIEKILPKIIKNKIEIVSGLALGVDTLAHQTTLNNQGKTIAVLGSGLNYIYPRNNKKLAENIISSGGILFSEFSPETPPLKENFPQRNRLISGLSQATLVIESKLKSGSLITAHWALEQNRELAAIPGNIFSEFSKGPNKLISSGARTITSAEDVLEIFKEKFILNKISILKDQT